MKKAFTAILAAMLMVVFSSFAFAADQAKPAEKKEAAPAAAPAKK